jgi:protein TonB
MSVEALMDPRDSQRTTLPGQTPDDAHPTGPRRMDPRLWLLLPLVALCILGAYFLGQRMTPEASAMPEPVVPQPVMQQVPTPPRGRITVTEVPRPAPAPARAVPTPAPQVVTPTPAPAPKPEPFHQLEPPVVLTPPADAGADTAAPANPAPDADTDSGSATKAPAEPDREPAKLNEPALEYPSSAYEKGVEGTARVAFVVTADGKVDDVRVTDSSGDSRLDQAAMDYVRRLKFRPGIRNGKPSDIRVTRSVRFQLR